MKNRLPWFLLLVLTASLAGAEDESTYTAEELVSAKLASFHQSIFDSLSEYNENPDAAAILVNCQLEYGSSNNNRTRCFLADPSHRKRFISEVQRLADRAKIDWAEVAGNLERTTIYFRVLLTREGDRAQISYFENWGHDAEKYGYDYQAPQRLLLYPRGPVNNGCRGQNLIYVVNVGVDGKATGEIGFEKVKGEISFECKEFIRERVAEYIFIPGRHNGNVAEIKYLELIQN